MEVRPEPTSKENSADDFNAKADLEFVALEMMFEALSPLNDSARGRVLAYFIARYNIDPGMFT